MSDSSNEIWPQWDTGERVESGTRVYSAEGFPGVITEVLPGRLKPVPGPYGGSHPPRITMSFEGGTEVGTSFDLVNNSKLQSTWRTPRAQPKTPISPKPNKSVLSRIGIGGLVVIVAASVVVGVLFRRKGS